MLTRCNFPPVVPDRLPSNALVRRHGLCSVKEGDWVYTDPIPGAKLEILVFQEVMRCSKVLSGSCVSACAPLVLPSHRPPQDKSQGPFSTLAAQWSRTPGSV